MNNLLIYFAFPIATIIISIAFQKILKNPFIVAGVIFSIYLIVTFAISDTIFLVATILYTVLSFITAYLTGLIIKKIEENNGNLIFTNEICNCNQENRVVANTNIVSENNGNTGRFYRVL